MILTRRNRLYIGCATLVVLNIIAIYYIYSLSRYYSVSPFVPSPDKTVLPVTLSYPPAVSGILQDEAVLVYFSLEANGTLAEGVNITISNAIGDSFTNNSLGKMVNDIRVGFRHTNYGSPFTAAYVTSGELRNYFYEGVAGAWLVNKTYLFELDLAIFKDPFPQIVFNFPASGDYSPTVIIGLDNRTFLTHTYDEIKVHVLSQAELRTQELDQINIFVSIALLFFTEVEAAKLIYEWIEKSPDRKESARAIERACVVGTRGFE